MDASYLEGLPREIDIMRLKRREDVIYTDLTAVESQTELRRALEVTGLMWLRQILPGVLTAGTYPTATFLGKRGSDGSLMLREEGIGPESSSRQFTLYPDESDGPQCVFSTMDGKTGISVDGYIKSGTLNAAYNVNNVKVPLLVRIPTRR